MQHTHCWGDDPRVVIAAHKTSFQGIRLGVSGWILQPDRLSTGCPQPARVADKTAWRSPPPHVAHDAAARLHVATVPGVPLAC